MVARSKASTIRSLIRGVVASAVAILLLVAACGDAEEESTGAGADDASVV